MLRLFLFEKENIEKQGTAFLIKKKFLERILPLRRFIFDGSFSEVFWFCDSAQEWRRCYAASTLYCYRRSVVMIKYHRGQLRNLNFCEGTDALL